MGMYSCKKHGLTAPRMTCTHAVQGMEDGVSIATTEVVATEGSFRVSLHLCGDCLAKWEGPDAESARDGILDAVLPVCCRCPEELSVVARA